MVSMCHLRMYQVLVACYSMILLLPIFLITFILVYVSYSHYVVCFNRIFASNLNAKMAQRFYNIVLLEKCRDDIRSNKSLNYHLYMALKKALFKPAAFYKGILLPLCQSQSCSLREATIIGSVLAKVRQL